MLKNHIPRQIELEVVTVEDLVPAEHLVRKIEPPPSFQRQQRVSNHPKANANKHQFEPIQVEQSTADYFTELNKPIGYRACRTWQEVAQTR